MKLHWPQIMMIVLMGLQLGGHLAMHGKPRSLHNVWWAAFRAVSLFVLLYAGGFFGVVA